MIFSKSNPFKKSIFKLNAMVEEFQAAECFRKPIPPPSPTLKWTPPPLGWLKANTNAAFNGERAAIGVVVQDHRGCVNLLSSKLIVCDSALEAELMALDWAIVLALEHG